MYFLPKKNLTDKSPSKKPPSLVLCSLFDVIGYASYAVPFLGEFSDIIWAPLSAYIFYQMFGGRFGVIGGGFSFLEEILPFTDFIPTFSIAWAIRNFKKPE